MAKINRTQINFPTLIEAKIQALALSLHTVAARGQVFVREKSNSFQVVFDYGGLPPKGTIRAEFACEKKFSNSLPKDFRKAYELAKKRILAENMELVQFYQQCRKCGTIYRSDIPVKPYAHCISAGCDGLAPYDESRQKALHREFEKLQRKDFSE